TARQGAADLHAADRPLGPDRGRGGASLLVALANRIVLPLVEIPPGRGAAVGLQSTCGAALGLAGLFGASARRPGRPGARLPAAAAATAGAAGGGLPAAPAGRPPGRDPPTQLRRLAPHRLGRSVSFFIG